MKALSIISYAIGFVLLIVSCFTTGVALTWWLGGVALICLILGCVFQYQLTKNRDFYRGRHFTH